jgi:hypothetical protein
MYSGKISFILSSDYLTFDISRNITYIDSISGIYPRERLFNLVLECSIPSDYVNMVHADAMVAVRLRDILIQWSERVFYFLQEKPFSFA